MKIAMIGTGVYSTALTYQLQKQKENDIYLWTEQPILVNKFNRFHKFDFLSKKIKFDSNVFLTAEIEEALQDASVIFILTSSKYFLEILTTIKPHYKKNVPIFVGTKGMNLEKNQFFSELTRKYLKCNSYTFFTGPTFANDLLGNAPFHLTFAGSNKIGYQKISRIFPTNLKAEYTNNLNGLELLATLKNIYAIGSGILAGEKVTDSVYYGYLSELLKETSTLLKKIYNSPETIFTYGGIGDFLLTTNSKNSRNFTLGKMIGSKDSHENINQYLKKTTVEGYDNLKQIPLFLNTFKIKNSILFRIYQIVFEEKEPEILYQIIEKEKNEIF